MKIQRRAQGGRSKYKGVSWYSRHSRWQAQIGANGIKRYLGRFRSEKAAALAYDLAAKAAYGAEAVLNFPKKGEKSAGWENLEELPVPPDPED